MENIDIRIHAVPAFTVTYKGVKNYVTLPQKVVHVIGRDGKEVSLDLRETYDAIEYIKLNLKELTGIECDHVEYTIRYHSITEVSNSRWS